MSKTHLLHIIKPIFAPLSAITLLMLGQGFFLTFISVYFNFLGHDQWLIGVVHSAFYAGMLIGAYFAEKLINRVGHIRAYAAFGAIGTACVLLQGLTSDPTVWTIARFITGFSMAVYYIVIESWFLDKGTIETRGVILSLYMIALYSSQAVGQYILNFVNINSAEPFYVAGILGALSAVPLTLTTSATPELSIQSVQTLGKLLKVSPFGVIGCVIAGIILSSIYSFSPIYALDVQIQVSFLVSVIIAGGVFLQWPLGRLSDIYDRRLVLLGVASFTLIPSILILFFPYNQSVVFPLAFILGGLSFTLYPLSITQVCDRLQPHDITKATSVLLIAYGTGAVFGPLIAPFFIELMLPAGLFLFIGVTSILLSVVGLVSFIYIPKVPESIQTDFVALPNVSPVVYELDPRSDGE
ncbi:MFS transporter [Chlamydiales bacterium]|nr:MFS transporter [Chlamydiales bacterium]